jgi:hypothetical protein
MEYNDCEAGTEVHLLTLNFAGHNLYPGEVGNPTT